MRRRTRPIDLLLVLYLALLPLIGAGCEAPGPDSDGAPSTQAIEPDVLDEVAASTLGDHLNDRYPADLDTILEKRFLRIVTSRNAFDFFLHDGVRGGYQYEMVKAFTAFLNRKHRRHGEPPIQFELIPVDDHQLIPMLREGAADLIAARMTITPERSARVAFSRPYRSVSEVLVSHDATPPIARVEDLSGQTIAVRSTSSYFESLVRLDHTLGTSGHAPIRIVRVDDALETERILELVAARRFNYTVADSMVAELAIEIQPRLRIVPGIVLREQGELAWSTLPEATRLLELMDAFLGRYDHGSLLGNLTKQKYFESTHRLADRFAAGKDTGLSEYDALFKRHGEAVGLDWLLVAAMANQESRFDPMAHNPSGAVGLMQIKPITAREPYVDIPEVTGLKNVSHNIEAGLKYLMWIKARYLDPHPEMREDARLRMALAVYNAGPRTLLRARARARDLGYDPNLWFRNVELAMLDMRKTEPVQYVSEINQRYLAYRLLLDRNSGSR